MEAEGQGPLGEINPKEEINISVAEPNFDISKKKIALEKDHHSESKEKESDEILDTEHHKGKSEIRSISEKENISKNLTYEHSTGNLLTQAELFKAYVEGNDLYIAMADFMYWFEFGGNSIGKFDITQSTYKWKLMAKYKHDFSSHFTLVHSSTEKCYYILGPNMASSCLQYIDKKILKKAAMLQEKSFFAGVFLDKKIYTFGGYDGMDKLQLKSCEVYDTVKDEWSALKCSLNQPRSQCATCVMDPLVMYIFGGYDKSRGTLASIERFQVVQQRIDVLDLKMPTPLRRFAAIKIAPNKILLLGGIQRLSKESDYVFCVDFEEHETIERLDRLNKAGVIEYPILVDTIGNLHLFIENCSGTSPPHHIVYSFLEYS